MSSPTRVAIVTGAALGLGRAIALRLAADGLHVVALERRRLLSDVTVEENVKNLVAFAVSTFGGLDVMVANAGTAFVKSILDTTLEDVDGLFNINFRAAFLSYKYAAKQMIAQGRGGRIIGAASAVAKKGFPFMSTYSATKFAIRALTQSAAQEWGAYGITVNAYCPGIIWTPLIEALGASLASVVGQADADPKEMASCTADIFLIQR
ncbi:hypothetical protein EW026_g5026 [Hermanssonia centrifuga]|uniref:NAD(P)-binding protein n=1 Tax=Hermanssonia centrifuga TaxID=98765 RepID=A0A4S4KGC1_9APHY|nr:hypothetical protein EW026_g5026 [Hermanssonia centrifuga]